MTLNTQYSQQYSQIAQYYDLWVTSGYYDYRSMAKSAHDIVGNGRHLLELGVGTGLLVEEYLKLDPNCTFTGIDFAPSMLEIAHRRLGEGRLGKDIKLMEADAVTMALNTTFDAAISNGGGLGYS